MKYSHLAPVVEDACGTPRFAVIPRPIALGL